MIDLLDTILVSVGLLFLGIALIIAHELHSRIITRKLRIVWSVVMGLIIAFIIGYVSLIWARHSGIISAQDIISLVSLILFFGAVFVIVMVRLSAGIIAGLQSTALELEGVNEHLEKKVRDRTVELERANNTKDILISVLNHDLKNPLTAIKGFSQLAMRKPNKKEMLEAFEQIEQCAEKMEGLISEARTLNLVEGKELAGKVEDIDIPAVLSEVIDGLTHASEKKKITVKKRLRPVQLQAHPLLRQVFLNLIDNAIKYSSEGSTIMVRMEKGKKDWTVSVEDEGDGVKDEYKELIFERFERADAKKGIEGSGIGLSIAKMIMSQQGGRVWVEDNSPKGSVFKVSLPRDR